MNPFELFYIKRGGATVEGPYDLVKMGDLLLDKSITPETPVRVEGSLEWKPFGEYPQYEVVRETSIDSATRLENSEKAAEARASFIPLPSQEAMNSFASKVVLLLILGTIACLVAWCDPTAGNVLAIVGVAVAALAHGAILGQVLNEDFSTIGKVSFVPLYDVYYFASNLDRYFSKFYVKYLAITVVIGAAAGMGDLHLHFRH